MMKKSINLKPLNLGLSVSLVISIASCAPQAVVSQVPLVKAPAQSTQTSGQPKTPATYRQVSFKIELPKGFQTQALPQAEAKYVKLTIMGSGATIMAVGADANGFVAIGDGVISANVPIGDNLTAKVGLYTNNVPGNQPILELGNAFHVSNATPGQITLNNTGLLVCNLVEILRSMSSTQLNTPINVSEYNNFSQNLINQLPAGQTQSNLNLNELAAKINNNTLTPNATTGTSTSPANLTIFEPEASFMVTPAVLGMFLPPPVNPSDKSLFLAESVASGGSASLFGVSTDPSYMTTDSTGLKRYQQNYKATATSVKSMAMALGSSNANLPTALGAFLNPPTNTQKNFSVPVSYAVLTSAGNSSKLELQARKQSNGAVAWSYNFGNTTFSTAADNVFVPVLKRITGVACLCDDEDLVMVGFAGSGGSNTGIHAVQSGTLQWSYNFTPTSAAGTSAPYVFLNGALSADGSTLYALVRDSSATPKAFLVALKTDPAAPPAGEKLWDVQLNGTLGLKPSLALGTDNSIYLYNIQSNVSYLQAYNPSNGNLKWEKSLGGTISTSASPIVDRKSSADIVYATAADKLYAFNSDGSNKWATPYDLAGFNPFFSPIVGEESSGRHVIYVGAFNSSLAAFPYKIFAITEDKSLLWSRAPWSSTLQAGFNLIDGRLMFTTYDGGEGSLIQLQGIKVSTPNMPAAAPWPKIFGNLRNSGKPYPSSQADI